MFLAANRCLAGTFAGAVAVRSSNRLVGRAVWSAPRRRCSLSRRLCAWDHCRHLPPQLRESRIVAVERDPFAAPLDGERCKPGIGDARSSRIGLDAKPLENVPVPLARVDDLAVRLSEKIC